MNQPTQLIKGVFIGDQITARDLEFFIRNNIKRVVNCTPDLPFYFPWVKGYRIPLNDRSDETNNRIMKMHLKNAIKFILEDFPTNENAVLIHCHAGVSRSCTVGAAVLRVCCAENIEHALAMVIAKRPIAFFNGTVVNFESALYQTFKS